MNEIDQAITKVRTEAATRGLRPATLARMAGLSANALRNTHHPDWDPRIETLRKVLSVLDEAESAA